MRGGSERHDSDERGEQREMGGGCGKEHEKCKKELWYVENKE